jgi:uncharacterized protein YbjT (DUF2867 family)
MILVSGPTGHVGAPLLEALAGGSDPARTPDAPARFGAAHGRVEGIIREAGVPFTFLRPNDFFQNALDDAPSIAADSRFYYPVPDARMSCGARPRRPARTFEAFVSENRAAFSGG